MIAPRHVAIAASVFGASAVALGAFGAHALRGRLDEAALQIWHSAVEYQFWHALALLGLAAAVAPDSAGQGASDVSGAWRQVRRSSLAFVLGIVLFCGSLYALALGAPRWIGVVTPVGGLCLIGGWIFLGLAWCSAARN